MRIQCSNWVHQQFRRFAPYSETTLYQSSCYRDQMVRVSATKSQKASLIFQLNPQKIVFELKPIVPCYAGVKAQHRHGACDRHRLAMLQTRPKVSHRCYSSGFEPFFQDNAQLDHSGNLIAGANRPNLKHQFPCKKKWTPQGQSSLCSCLFRHPISQSWKLC